jgi:site-specific DNA-methyltransferase (adenine-specific)
LNGETPPSGSAKRVYSSNSYDCDAGYGKNKTTPDIGRYPANIIMDEESGKILDGQTGVLKSGAMKKGTINGYDNSFIYGTSKRFEHKGNEKSAGGASRFFYCAKVSKKERGEGNTHPTVKPLKLMEYLCKMTMSPTKGVVLDPFMGSGTTGIACKNTNRDFIGIEIDSDSLKIAKERMKDKISKIEDICQGESY